MKNKYIKSKVNYSTPYYSNFMTDTVILFNTYVDKIYVFGDINNINLGLNIVRTNSNKGYYGFNLRKTIKK